MTRTSKLIVAMTLSAAVVGTGAAIAVAQQDPEAPDLDRAVEAAQAATGDGQVVAVEQDDDGTYEVEVRRPDGGETDVDLDASFAVIRTEQEDAEDDDDDEVLDDASRARAATAALATAAGGTVVSVEADDGGYDVEVRHADGTETEVTLDANFQVVHSEQDDD
jgi:uncharacterized membrane protein YkoI